MLFELKINLSRQCVAIYFLGHVRVGRVSYDLQRMWSVCVVMTLSASCRLIPWHNNENERLLESTVIEIFDDVIQPPSLLASIFDAFVRRWRPSMVHRISAAGWDGAVTQWKFTTSPCRASVGPVIVTCDGETRDVIGKNVKLLLSFNYFRSLLQRKRAIKKFLQKKSFIHIVVQSFLFLLYLTWNKVIEINFRATSIDHFTSNSTLATWQTFLA